MKYTLETFQGKIQNLLPESNIILENFQGTEKPCQIKCLNCGQEIYFSEAQFIIRRYRRGNKNACKNCEDNKYQQIKNLIDKTQIVPLANISTLIRSNKEKIQWKCLKCNNTFERAPFVFYYNHAQKCPWCESRAFEYTEEMIKYKIIQKWGNEYSYINNAERSKQNQRRIKVKHNVCGFIWDVDFYHFCTEGTGCPRCKDSKGERKVSNYLKKYNIPFKQQKAIEIEKNHYLRFDFFIESKNIAIEYNGVQHYKPIKYFGGEEGFIKQQKCDKEKKEYCKQNNIELIIIPYNDESLLSNNLLAQRLGGQVPED